MARVMQPGNCSKQPKGVENNDGRVRRGARRKARKEKKKRPASTRRESRRSPPGTQSSGAHIAGSVGRRHARTEKKGSGRRKKATTAAETARRERGARFPMRRSAPSFSLSPSHTQAHTGTHRDKRCAHRPLAPLALLRQTVRLTLGAKGKGRRARVLPLATLHVDSGHMCVQICQI